MKAWYAMLGIWMSAVIYEAFALPEIRGLVGHLIAYFHPPIAIVTFIAFLVAMIHGLRYLRWNDPIHDVKSSKAAEVGLLFCFLATVTGAMWSKANWGTFWSWDPKQTSIFVVLLIYAAYFSLRSSTPNPDRRHRLCAVYTVIGFISAVLLMFILPRIGFSLHPNDAMMGGGSDRPVRLLFWASVLGFSGVFAWMMELAVKLALMEMKIKEMSQ